MYEKEKKETRDNDVLLGEEVILQMTEEYAGNTS
jgi:hypothetical protein